MKKKLAPIITVSLAAAFAAGPGYDLATGLGSPLVTASGSALYVDGVYADSVPEPAVGLYVMLGLGAALLRRRRSQRE